MTEVYLSDVLVGKFSGNMADLTSAPISLSCNLNGRIADIEYGVSTNNPVFYCKMNGEYWQDIPSGPEPSAPLTFERGPVQSNRAGQTM